MSERHPGKFRVYWLFFDIISGGNNLPEGINSYIFHATDFDLMANSSESFVYAHIPGVFIFGMTEDHDQAEWKDLRVGFSGGLYAHADRKIPGFIGTLIQQKVNTANSAKASVSPSQKEKITKDALRNPDQLLRSPLTRSTFADVRLSEPEI